MTSADNQQETFLSPARNFYYSGFFAGEMSCSIIRAAHKGIGHYYTPDLTVSNNDLNLLQEVNVVVAQSNGVITAIKGGYNLSIRGKKKVSVALAFFDDYPVIVGDLANSKLLLLQQAMNFLSQRISSKPYSPEEKEVIEGYRAKLQHIKQRGQPIGVFEWPVASNDAIGYFLAGVIDAEGSIGLKKRVDTYQPFFALAMKDRKIVELLKEFLGYGSVRYRLDGMYHYETGCLHDVLATVELFTSVYPCKQQHTRERMERLKRILNDHTRDTRGSILYDGQLW